MATTRTPETPTSKKVHSGNGRVQTNDSTVSAGTFANGSDTVEKLHRVPAFDIEAQAGDFVERLCTLHGSKEVASQLDRGYTAIRRWAGEPERIPLVKAPVLHRLAEPSDPFWPRLNESMGYRLLPLSPTPEQIIAALEEANVLKRGQTKTARRVVRGLRRDDRQPALWGSE